MPKPITSLEDFIRKLAHLENKYPNTQLFFRGHSSKEHKVSPSIFRNQNHKSAEHLMIRQLIAQQPEEFMNDTGIFDQLVRAQHYGLPTRLLDVSLNPLVALYFATNSRSKSRAEIVVFKPDIGAQKYYDSDTVSILSNLSLLTAGEKETIKIAGRHLLSKRKKSGYIVPEEELSEFNEIAEVKKLVQLVRHEKPDFRPIIQPIDLAKPISVVPKKLHKRILAQNGGFILFGLADQPNNSNIKHIDFEIIDISEESKPRFIKELAQVGITESALFPEIERAALAIKRRYS